MKIAKTDPSKKKTAKKKVAKKVVAKKTAKKKPVARKRNKAQWVRHHVKVNGKEFNSVPAAFKALRLPMGRMIRFRMELKKAGKLVFEGKKFSLVRN